MKSLFTILTVAAIIAISNQPVMADTAFDKLGRGIQNVATAVFELPKTWSETSQADGIASGFTKGTFDGVARLLLKGVVGAYEIVTFPIGVPENYEPVLKQ